MRERRTQGLVTRRDRVPSVRELAAALVAVLGASRTESTSPQGSESRACCAITGGGLVPWRKPSNGIPPSGIIAREGLRSISRWGRALAWQGDRSQPSDGHPALGDMEVLPERSSLRSRGGGQGWYLFQTASEGGSPGERRARRNTRMEIHPFARRAHAASRPSRVSPTSMSGSPGPGSTRSSPPRPRRTQPPARVEYRRPRSPFAVSFIPTPPFPLHVQSRALAYPPFQPHCRGPHGPSSRDRAALRRSAAGSRRPGALPSRVIEPGSSSKRSFRPGSIGPTQGSSVSTGTEKFGDCRLSRRPGGRVSRLRRKGRPTVQDIAWGSQYRPAARAPGH